ncbi:hypothetical protein [Microtetraspora sp. NBRC 16547]|uniref:hypothetical protein n=1 Tax=Microtetraspora sp. NBRC 16547 TaxID=3030993 RepID=UPI0024A2AA91|nr:hypothetical protein [Microtetraspora sp. NBRC 16547]GLX02742.1 hypothetical protein Misp02_68280 [Microtetraspora sp. NBRC 16547]
MRRSVPNLLALAAVTATVALGIPAISTAASASTTGTASASADNNPYWGPYWSRNRLAKTNGYIDIYWNSDTSNSINITGKLWDLDSRTQRQGGKCAYVKFRFQDLDDVDDSSPSFKSYKYCGSGGSRDFSVQRSDLRSVQVQVCQIGGYSKYPTKCGYWYWLGGDRLNGN